MLHYGTRSKDPETLKLQLRMIVTTREGQQTKHSVCLQVTIIFSPVSFNSLQRKFGNLTYFSVVHLTRGVDRDSYKDSRLSGLE